jgi:ABC-2 type transport system permease protein
VTEQPTSDLALPHPHRLAPESGGAAVGLLSGADEARAFWRMRLRIVSTLLRQTFADAWFRLALIAALSGLLWAGLFWLFADGFDFLRKSIPSADLHDQAVRAVFGMFFAALSAMLVFSSGIILYSSLFRGPDVALLLTMPARAERVFLHKFQEAILLSSWAFLLLGSPMVLAYGVVISAPWYYFALLLPLLLAFTYVPAALGAILCLLIVRYLPRGRVLLLAAIVAVLLAAGVWLGWSVVKAARTDMMTPSWFQDLLDRLSIADIRLLPSWWLTSGLMEAGENLWSESLLFLALLLSNAMFFRLLAVWTAARVYRAAYSRLHAERYSRKRTRIAWMDRAVGRATAMLPGQVRLLIIKDLRLFRRDPVQWSQFLIFFGLLLLYFVNIRRFRYDAFYTDWVNMVSLLNLSVVGLLLSTFTTRFIFPMISLEGRRFWILGLLPLERDTILWSKFLFAICGSVLPCSGLILLSDVMLRVRPAVVAGHQLTCLILCFGLSGIAVGLGAKMPSLREQSPSRIAAGFGGTLNLVFSTLFIAVILVLSALPCHFYFGASTSRLAGWLAKRAALEAWIELWLVGGNVVAVVLGAAATVVPLGMGLRAFRRMEF